MKSPLSIVTVVAVVVVLAAEVQSRPQYGSGGGGGGEGPDCITKFREVNDITNKEEFRNVCKPVTKLVVRSIFYPFIELACH